MLGMTKVVDLFCGVGGLTHGFVLEGFDVVAGVDIDNSCRYPFEKNNRTKFVHRNVSDLSSSELNGLFGNAEIKILVGCAPCQPFSALNRKNSAHRKSDKRWEPLEEFGRLIAHTKPAIISMENVPDLAKEKKYPIFKKFLASLRKNKYHVFYRVVDASKYGVPQKRKRLVLLASKFGEINLVPETKDKNNLVTVRDAIFGLKHIKDGEVDRKDPLHRASKLSPLNKRRVMATPKNGGNAKSWKPELMPACYKKASGHSYMSSVYGRMKWDEPSPTITTHCVNLGTGRFGHPSQNRAISLREAALLQSFPSHYRFNEGDNVSMTKTARLIGNAVPVLLGRAIASSIKNHLENLPD